MVKDFSTGTRLYTNMGAARKGWTVEEEEEEMPLFKHLSALAWMDKSEFARKCNHQGGNTGKSWRSTWKGSWRGQWKATALTWWANSQVISGGPADILKVHFSQWLETCVVGTKSFRKEGGYHQKLEFTLFSKGFPHGSFGKKPTCNAGDLSLIPGSGRSPREGIGYLLQYCWASLVAQLEKKFTCNVGDLGWILGLGRSPGERKGYPHQYSDLENSMDCIVHGVAKS